MSYEKWQQFCNGLNVLSQESLHYIGPEHITVHGDVHAHDGDGTVLTNKSNLFCVWSDDPIHNLRRFPDICRGIASVKANWMHLENVYDNILVKMTSYTLIVSCYGCITQLSIHRIAYTYRSRPDWCEFNYNGNGVTDDRKRLSYIGCSCMWNKFNIQQYYTFKYANTHGERNSEWERDIERHTVVHLETDLTIFSKQQPQAVQYTYNTYTVTSHCFGTVQHI